MGWIVAAIVMVGVSAESARLDANDAAMRNVPVTSMAVANASAEVAHWMRTPCWEGDILTLDHPEVASTACEEHDTGRVYAPIWERGDGKVPRLVPVVCASTDPLAPGRFPSMEAARAWFDHREGKYPMSCTEEELAWLRSLPEEGQERKP